MSKTISRPNAIGLALLALIASCSGASAHARLKSSVPAEGATVETAREIRLQFSEPVELALSQVHVETKKGEVVPTEPLSIDASDPSLVLLTLKQPLPPGHYTVRWRVTSVDTHKMLGGIAFDVKP